MADAGTVIFVLPMVVIVTGGARGLHRRSAAGATGQ